MEKGHSEVWYTDEMSGLDGNVDTRMINGRQRGLGEEANPTLKRGKIVKTRGLAADPTEKSSLSKVLNHYWGGKSPQNWVTFYNLLLGVFNSALQKAARMIDIRRFGNFVHAWGVG